MEIVIEIQEALKNFEGTSSEKFIQILNQIKEHLKSQITQDYLQGKIHAIVNTIDENEKKKLCKNLKPYLEWYLQGS